MSYDDAVRMDLGLRALHAFVTVIDEGHFGRAASRLFVTAPALSQQIRRLEQQLGMRLIDRDAHPVRPTSAGETLLPHAHRMLRAAQETAVDLNRFSRRQDRVLRLGFINGGPNSLTTSLLSKVASPLELVQLQWHEQLSEVASGAVDAAFVRPPMPLIDGLTLERVTVEPRVVMLHRGHRFAERESVTIDDLDDEMHVSTDRAAAEWIAYWAVDPRPSGRPVRWGPLVRTMDEQLQTVAAGLGIAITAASLADYHSSGEVSFVPITGIEPCTVELCTRTGDDHPGVLELRRVVAELPAARGSAREDIP